MQVTYERWAVKLPDGTFMTLFNSNEVAFWEHKSKAALYDQGTPVRVRVTVEEIPEERKEQP